MRFMLTVLCNVMLRRVPCYRCASLRDTGSKSREWIFVAITIYMSEQF